MKNYVDSFLISISEFLSMDPEFIMKWFYIGLFVLVLVVIIVAIFKRMKKLLAVSVFLFIMFLVLSGVPKNATEALSKEIDEQYCLENPETFWC